MGERRRQHAVEDGFRTSNYRFIIWRRGGRGKFQSGSPQRPDRYQFRGNLGRMRRMEIRAGKVHWEHSRPGRKSTPGLLRIPVAPGDVTLPEN